MERRNKVKVSTDERGEREEQNGINIEGWNGQNGVDIKFGVGVHQFRWALGRRLDLGRRIAAAVGVGYSECSEVLIFLVVEAARARDGRSRGSSQRRPGGSTQSSSGRSRSGDSGRSSERARQGGAGSEHCVGC